MNAPPPPPARGGRLMSWIRQHKMAAGAAGVGAVLGLVVLAKRGASSSTSGSTAADGSATGTSTSPSVYGSGYDTSGYDQSMEDLANALDNFTAANAGSSGTSSSSGGSSSGSSSGGTSTLPNPNITVKANAKSWTDTGQTWSAAQLAKALGIPLSALRASNPLASKGLANPNSPLAKNASFTYFQTPAQAAAGTKPKPRKPPVVVRRTPQK